MAVLLPLLLLAGAMAPARAADPPFPRDLVQAVLATAFDVILDRHLEAALPGELGLWALRGLEVIEPGLRPELRAGTLLLSDARRLLGARPMPGAVTPGAAAAATRPLAVGVAALFDAAWRASPALRQAGVERLLQSAFEEVFNHLDPYSRYLTPQEAAAARQRRIGQSALGLQLAPGPGGSVVVAAVTPGGTADRVGLRAGDRVLSIEGERVSARRLAEAVALLEGPVGSATELRLLRGGRRLALLLPREVIPPETVQATRRDDILWLRIEGFANDTDLRLAEALAAGLGQGATQGAGQGATQGATQGAGQGATQGAGQGATQGAGQGAGQGATQGAVRGVVLDLRGNRGGLLGQAVAVASTFLAAGPVARTAGRHPDAARTYLAGDGDRAGGLPLVVLIDGRSASAAEIVAAALTDRGRAVAVGSATMGKGLVQVVAPLPNGGELQVSWSQVLAPSGWPIQGLGVLPALCTAFGEEATAAALRALGRGEPPLAPVLARARQLRPPAPAAELAALRAACPPAEGREADPGAARALLGSPPAHAAGLQR